MCSAAILTCDGIVASCAFLCHSGLVAVHTEGLLLVGGEAGASQWLPALGADETLRMPGLVLVVHPSSGDGLGRE